MPAMSDGDLSAPFDTGASIHNGNATRVAGDHASHSDPESGETDRRPDRDDRVDHANVAGDGKADGEDDPGFTFDPLAQLPERTEANPGLPFQPEVKAAILELKLRDRGQYEKLLADLRKIKGFNFADAKREFREEEQRKADKKRREKAAEAKPKSVDGVTFPPGYSMNEDGLHYRSPEDLDASPIWICGPFKVLAVTRDERSLCWGLLLRWDDPDGVAHKWAMPISLVHREGGDIAAELHSNGLACGTSRAAHDRLKNFFGRVATTLRTRCVGSAGWHSLFGGGMAYVLANGEVFGGSPGDTVVLQTASAKTGAAFVSRGTLEEWKQRVARYAVGNDRMGFAISAAFAGPLLRITDDQSGGIHFSASSSIGKTTALLAAPASVWGPADVEHQMRTWRATSNGFEGVAGECSDGLLLLDELGEADPRDVAATVYMLANERGKTRSTRDGSARPIKVWRVIFISAGERTLDEVLAAVSQRASGGLKVRLPQIPADAGSGLGVYQELHGMQTGADLSDYLREATKSTCYGTAGPVFVEQLAKDRNASPEELRCLIRVWRDRFIEKYLPAGASGEVRRVAGRFALIAAAGEIATAYGITGWPEGEATRAAAGCLNACIEERGDVAPEEERQALIAVHGFIAANGSARFSEITEQWDQAGKGVRVVSERPVPNRAGFKERGEDGWEYLIETTVWTSEVCKGLNAKTVARVMRERGALLDATASQPAARRRIPGEGRRRFYCVGPHLFEDTQEPGSADEGLPNG